MLDYILEEGEKRRAMLGGISEKVDQGVCITCLIGFLTIGCIGIL